MIRKALFNRHSFFWLITFSALVGLTLPVLIQDGMFMDGMLYSSVAHNMAEGYGTFWFPKFSQMYVNEIPSFHEHPPLVFGIQSLFFRLFGDSMYVERFYTFLMMCIMALLINQFWKSAFRNSENLKRMGWLPILLWITIPDCFWSYSNNMQENTMGVFTLLSVLYIYNYLQKDKPRLVLLILAGVFIFLATFSKGFPGFFPAAVPFVFWLATKRISFSKAVINTAVLLAVPLFIYAILFCIPASRESLSVYLFKRVLQRISSEPTVGNRFYTLISLSQELFPLSLFTVTIILMGSLRKIKILQDENKNLVWFFLGVGFAASLPLMLTMVQKAFYYVPSLPFFAIASAVMIAPTLLHFINRIEVAGKKYKMMMAAGMVLLVSVILFSFMQKGKASRDEKMLNDVYAVGYCIPKFSVVDIPDRIWNKWSLHCYFSRYFNISLVTGHEANYYLIEKDSVPENASVYKRFTIPTEQYDLFLKTSQ